MIQNKDFVHLHTHSCLSLLDGLSHIKKLVEKARKSGFQALALTDHGNIGGWIQFIQECRSTVDKNGDPLNYPTIKPILGCLLKGQEIVTIDGVKCIEDIRIGDKVLTHTGLFQNVTKMMKRIYTGYFYDIYLSGSKNNKLTLTEEHPIFVRNYCGEINWMKPPEISFGLKAKTRGMKHWNNYVCLPKIKSSCNVTKIDILDYLPHIFCSENGYIYKCVKSNKYDCCNEWENINRYLLIDNDFSYFLGLYTAEGSVCRKKNNHNELNGQIILSFHKKESKLINFCSNFIKNRFNLVVGIHKRTGIKKNCVDIYFCCLPLAYFLANVCGKGAKNKCVPPFIFNSCQEIKDFYLNGVLDGDGKDLKQPKNVCKSQNLHVSSIKLVWGVRQLLVNRGVWSTIVKSISVDEDKKCTSYSLSYNPFRKYSRTIEDDDYIYKPILKIVKKWGREEVFNFSVENDQSYVSDFILHNCEFYTCRKMEWQSKDKQPDLRKGNRHLILLAKNWEGYQNLCYLSNESFTKGFYFDPRIDLEILAANSKGIMVSSACLSSLINANLYFDRYDAAKKAASIFKDIFKEDFFLEVMFHGINAQAKIIPDIIKLGKELDIPLIATQDAHYLEKDQALSQEVLSCMNMSRCLKDPKHNRMPYDEFYLKSAEEMMKIFKDIPQVIYNTLSVAERVDSEDIVRNLFISGMRLPKIDIPAPFKDAQEYLEYLAWEGMKKIGWDKSEEHVKRLKLEIGDIKVAKENNNYDFATYFLIVRDYVNYANEKGVLVGPGRGSCYASVLLRCINVTYGLDPMCYNLFWERFLGFCGQKFVTEKDFGFDSKEQLVPISQLEENYDGIENDSEDEEI